MDPDATLQLLLEAYWADDIDGVAEHASNLDEWLFKGGFAPQMSRDQLMTVFAALGAIASIAHKGGLSMSEEGTESV